MSEELTRAAGDEKILKTFREAGVNDTVNFKHEKGSIFEAGGILSKLDKKGDQYFAIDGQWVPAFA